jgi:hypothetical protein
MSNAIPKECMALLKEASEMFSETGCVPGIDGEEVPAETIVPNAKEYISETIDDPEAIYDPEIWDTSGFALVLSWLAQKWNQRCRKLAPVHGEFVNHAAIGIWNRPRQWYRQT